MKRISPKVRGGNPYSFSLVFIEVPGLVTLGKHKAIGVDGLDAEADVAEGCETVELLDEEGVGGGVVYGVALDVEAVALMLEMTPDFSVADVADEGE